MLTTGVTEGRKETKPRFGRLLYTTSGLETEWDYSGRKGRDGQKKKIGKANERKRKVKRGKVFRLPDAQITTLYFC